jgi:hypothetical protein
MASPQRKIYRPVAGNRDNEKGKNIGIREPWNKGGTTILLLPSDLVIVPRFHHSGVPIGFSIWIIFQFVDQIFCESLTRARKERQIAPQASAGYCSPNSPRLTSAKHSGGREKKSSMRPQGTPATAKKGQLPHDRKQYDFPSGLLESLDISKIPAL